MNKDFRGRFVIWPVSKFQAYPNNPRLHEDHVEKFAALIKEHGFWIPMLAKSDGEIVDGHFRLKAGVRAGLKQFPTIIVSGLSEKKIKALRLSINRMAEVADWNADALIQELESLKGDLDFTELSKLTAFEPDELRDFLEENVQFEAEDGAESNSDEVDILGPGEDVEALNDQSPIMSFKDDVQFAQVGLMGLPPIRKDLLIQEPPKDLFCYNKDSTVGVDWKKTVVCFFTADRQFERLWVQTAAIVTRFRNLGIKGIVTPDWSTFFGWPRALRVYNIYRSRFIGRYCQEAGIPVIVNVSGSDQDLEYIWDGLPKNCPLAIEIQAKYTKDETARHTRLLETVLAFQPKYLLVYAPQNRLEMFPVLRQNKVRIQWVTPRMIVRRQKFQHESNSSQSEA